MEKIVSRLGTMAASGLILTLSGCVLLGERIPVTNRISGLQPAAMPSLQTGDRIYFTNGRREIVTGVENGQVSIRRSKRVSYRLHNDFLLPEISRESSKKEVTQKLLTQDGSIWPLMLDKKTEFKIQRHSSEKLTGVARESIRNWRCKVDATEALLVAAGEFKVYRIHCTRYNRRMRMKSERIWYYAPAVGRYVLRIDLPKYGQPRRLELTAFEPSLAMLPDKARRNYQARFQQVMERGSLEETSVWESPAHRTRIEISLKKSYQSEGGDFCRNYQTTLNYAGGVRQGVGMVCRNPGGEWKIPRKINGGIG